MDNNEQPRQIGRYTILRELGQGAMAQVYLAELSTLGGFRRKVALKIVKSEFARDPKFGQLMAREAMIGSRLQHPNIVETLEFNESDGRMFLALEFVEGETVEELLVQSTNDGRPGLPMDLAVEIVIQVLKGLSYAHNLISPEGEPMGIIHRDLKPGNIMVSRHGSVKVMDFGIAKAKVACATITAAGQVRGTPIYMAPEQVTGKPLDARCDQFATATVLYELVCGEQLFIARNLIDIMRRVARAEVGDGIRKLERRQPGLGAIVERMWAVSSEDRYADCADAARALEDLLPEVRSRMASPEPDDTIDTMPPLSEDDEPTRPNRGPEPPPTREVPVTSSDDEDEEDEEASGGWLGSLFRRKEKKPEPKKKRKKKRRRREDSGRMSSPGESGGMAPPGGRRRRKKKRRTSTAGAPVPGQTSSQPISPPEPTPPPIAEEPEPEPAVRVAQLGPSATDEPSFDGPLRPEPALAEASKSFPPERPPPRAEASDSISMIWEETTFGESTEGGIAPVREAAAPLAASRPTDDEPEEDQPSPAPPLEDEPTVDGFEVQSSPLMRGLREDEPTGPTKLHEPAPATKPQPPEVEPAQLEPEAVTKPQTPTIKKREEPQGSTSVAWSEKPTAGLRAEDDDEGDGAPMDSFFFGDEGDSEPDEDGDDAPMDSFFFED